MKKGQEGHLAVSCHSKPSIICVRNSIARPSNTREDVHVTTTLDDKCFLPYSRICACDNNNTRERAHAATTHVCMRIFCDSTDAMRTSNVFSFPGAFNPTSERAVHFEASGYEQVSCFQCRLITLATRHTIFSSRISRQESLCPRGSRNALVRMNTRLGAL